MYTAGRRQCIRVDVPCCMTTSGPDVNESVRNASLSKPGTDTSAGMPGKKLIWWLQGNSNPESTAASLNHAEYQRRA
ncbi:hypothetical protein ACP0HM_17320 [Escherichia coli]